MRFEQIHSVSEGGFGRRFARCMFRQIFARRCLGLSDQGPSLRTQNCHQSRAGLSLSLMWKWGWRIGPKYQPTVESSLQ